jgi:hypothetical protein
MRFRHSLKFRLPCHFSILTMALKTALHIFSIWCLSVCLVAKAGQAARLLEQPQQFL